MSIIRNLESRAQRCRVYKLNISKCLTEKEQGYYNIYCDGISQKRLIERIGKKFYTNEDVANTFNISVEEAKEILDAQLDRKSFKELLINEIEKFPKEKVRTIKSSAIYVSDEDGKITNEKRVDNQIVWFENECVRRCNSKNLKDIPLLEQFIILKCKSMALEGIIKQIVERGIDIDDKHYIFFTSSTGQMKDCEMTLLEQNYWEQNKETLMCGLTEERINAKGGINMGKYLAAKALNISNSVKLDTEINIDEVIIVPDFKTMVEGKVNYLDVDTLDIIEREIGIDIEHMDGAGIFIPGVLPCSCQIRGGWLKGAVFPFDFHKFIETFRDSLSDVHMTDAWGDTVSVEEFLNAKIILTDSQLKMRKYYNSLNEYREMFKKNQCCITLNNVSHPPKKKSEVRVSYQPLQTIRRGNIKDDSIGKLTEKTIAYINDAKENSDAALKLMGIDSEAEKNADDIPELKPLYASILKYPGLLYDTHVRKTMKNALDAERKKAMGCKLIMDGLWSYICPDLYAFCEWLFLGKNDPKGLITKGNIYNKYCIESNIKEVCCLRYPHLSDCEHAVRKIEETPECQKWFIGYDTVVSCHDLISKALQADWDGDHICLVFDEAFLDVLDKDQCPLYYHMEKAQPAEITNEGIMDCLKNSFSNENIGYVSNAITKIFNSLDVPDTNFVKVLCAYNNFVIDYFKTQKSMDLRGYADEYEKYKDSDTIKCPYFFKYANGKKSSSCEPFNPESNVDRISKFIQKNTRENITKTIYDKETGQRFEPELLKDKSITVKRDTEYNQLRKLLLKLKQEQMNLYKKVKQDINCNLSYRQIFNIYCVTEIEKIISDRKKAVNYLIDLEYCAKEFVNDKKDILWNCYGDILFENLSNNVKNNNDDNPVKAKRCLYESAAKKKQMIVDSRQAVFDKQKELGKVSISKSTYNYLMDIQTIKSRKNDKYIAFILYVLAKRFQNRYGEENNYVRIYKNSRTEGKVTCASIDNWIESKCTKAGLKQLEEKGFIKIEECQKYFKISLLNVPESNDSHLYIETYNPLLDLFSFNGDRKIKECEICKRKFHATGNDKTCSKKCSDVLLKINKNAAVKMCNSAN